MSQDSETGKVVLDALDRTASRKTARVELQVLLFLDFDRPESRSSSRPPGTLMRRLVRELGRRVSRLLLRGLTRLFRRFVTRKISAQPTVGVLDFEAHRCMYGYRSYVMLVDGDRVWQGAPGTSVASLSSKPAAAYQPLWLFDLLRGVEQAQAEGMDIVEGLTCRRFLAHANLIRAADAVPYDMAVPAGIDQLADLTRLPVGVWVDERGHLRRVSVRHFNDDFGRNSSTVSVTELGTQPPSDWSRLESL